MRGDPTPGASPHESTVIFLAGDVMTGRGVDQILPKPGSPELRESHVTDARRYVALAENISGPIPGPVRPPYIWGQGLTAFERFAPEARIINLETAVTSSNDFWPEKAVHYRMNPGNVECLTTARIDVCCLANNHVLDFGPTGLVETLATLHAEGLQTAGAGRDILVRVPLSVGALLVSAFGASTSGIPRKWGATNSRPGVHLLADLTEDTAATVAAALVDARRPGDLALASIHWGSNWGFEVSSQQVRFAHRLIESGVDVVHGHSSHHVRPIEIYRGRLVLYGCGDLLTDYEGIQGHEVYRGDLGLMYFVRLTRGGGALVDLRMAPMRLRRMALERASSDDTRWLAQTLSEISRPFGTSFQTDAGGIITLS
jgi:poly-gamma-glutamate capsule biosynthesis protein CapA/YwtB (metallophosphatase superfamily)